jgi:polysaccharide biosynthesis transport protein
MIVEQYNRIPLPEQVKGVWQRRKWVMILAFLATFPAGVAMVLALPPLYRASATLLVGEGDISTQLVNPGPDQSLAARLDVIRKAILSRSHLEPMIERFDLYPQLREQPKQVVIDRLRKDIGIKQEIIANQTWQQEAPITLTLTYQSQDPMLAADVANELANMYQQQNQNLLQTRSQRTAEFLRTQLDQVSDRLAKQEQLITNFRNEHLCELPEQQSLSLATLEQLNAELRMNGDAQLALMERRDTLLTGNTLGIRSSASLAEAASATGLSELELRRMELDGLLDRYTERHPDVIRLKNEITRLEAEPQPTPRTRDNANTPDSPTTARRRPELDGITQELAVLADERESLRARISELQTRIESSPGLTQELLALNHEYNTIREQHLSLQNMYEEARLNASMEQEQNRQFQVLEPALAPNAPAAPNRFRIIVMGFILSVGFA